MSWNDIYKSNDCCKSIIMYIIKYVMCSKDHIAGAWIFDGNLSYEIQFNRESLNQCAGHGKENVVVDEFFDQVQVGIKKEYSRKKNMRKKSLFRKFICYMKNLFILTQNMFSNIIFSSSWSVFHMVHKMVLQLFACSRIAIHHLPIINNDAVI